MDIRELRIGNLMELVATSPTETLTAIGAVTGIMQDKVFLGDAMPVPLKNLRAIPLTEEWLLKAGIKTAPLLEKGAGVYWYTGYNPHTPILYVHQLQNLYFALTGSELEFQHPSKGSV